MAAEQPGSPEQESEQEPRSVRRYRSHAVAIVFRASDVMRTGIQAHLTDVSAEGVGFDMDEPLDVDEQVKLTLRNDIQRIETETRGTVRQVCARGDGLPGWHVGVQLASRLAPLDVSLLKSGIGYLDSDGPTWI